MGVGGAVGGVVVAMVVVIAGATVVEVTTVGVALLCDAEALLPPPQLHAASTRVARSATATRLTLDRSVPISPRPSPDTRSSHPNHTPAEGLA